MKKIIIIKYGELNTKKGNINYFIKILKKNIITKLSKESVNIIFDQSRMYIIPLKENFETIIKSLSKTFGIHQIMIGYETESNDIEIIKESVITLLKDKSFKTFKIETKRINKEYPLKSPEISDQVGAYVLEHITNISVDVHNPELEITLEIRNTMAYVYFETIEGIKGLPVGVSGKGLLMLSGGIDSPVAGYLALKRGIKLEAIYFESPPHTSINAKNKVIKLAKTLSDYGNDIKIHIVNLTEIQEAIYKNIPHEYLITILRRMMYRISTKIAFKTRAHVLVNGENIGQVASQTLTSMKVIDVVSTLPIIRPLACFDKLEIIKIAEQINTYETSILPYEDCCTIFVPKHPVINPYLRQCLAYEALIPYEEFIKTAIAEHEIIETNNFKFSDIL